MVEKIVDVNVADQSAEDLKSYAIYVARCRAIPDITDGLKPVIRRILWCAAHDFRGQGFIRTSAIMGEVIKNYNPHGDTSVVEAIKNMINDFSTKIPTMEGSGSWGHKSNPYASAPRYTSCKISQFAVDVFIQDIYDDIRTTDWKSNYDNKCLEPCYLPSKIPTVLVLGQLGIGVGMKTSIPSHNLGDVIDVTIGLMKNPNMKFCLVPDECMKCEIHQTDFQKINDTGMGTYISQGIVDIGEYNNHPALFVRSLPDFTYFDSVKEKIISLVESKKMPYIIDIISRSTVDEKTAKAVMEEVIVLSKGADPYFVKEFLYTNTAMRQTRQVKLIVIKDNKYVMMNYREALLNFIDFRRNVVFRKMNALLQKFKTAIHERETYIKAMTSGEIDNIIKMIRKQKTTDDTELMEYLIAKLHITSLQAKFLLNTDLKRLSAGNLDKYRKELASYQAEERKIMDIILVPENIDKYIINEMLEIKKKYNTPKLCKILSTSEAKGIAPGVFKLIFTKKGFVRKIGENDSIGTLNNDVFNFSITVSNEEDIIVFSNNGKAHRLIVSKIPLYAKGSNGIDIRVLNKFITAPIVCAARIDTLERLASQKKFKNFIFVISKLGFVKKIDIDDMITVPYSGFIYSKLDQDDIVQTILFGPDKMDLLIYFDNKVLRLAPKNDVPYLKRSTKGNRASTSRSFIEGMNFALPNKEFLIITTKGGFVNKIPLEILPVSTRGKAGMKVIKLHKGDSILGVWTGNNEDTLVVNDVRSIKRVPIKDISIGATISVGIPLFNSPIYVGIE